MKAMQKGFLLIELLLALCLFVVSILIVSQAMAGMLHYLGRTLCLLHAHSAALQVNDLNATSRFKRKMVYEPVALYPIAGQSSAQLPRCQWVCCSIYESEAEQQPLVQLPDIVVQS